MDWKIALASYGAVLSTILAMRQWLMGWPWRSVEPIINLDTDRLGFRISFHNDRQDSVHIRDGVQFGRVDLITKSLGADLDTDLRNVYDAMKRRPIHLLIRGKGALGCDVTVPRDASRLLLIFLWQRPSWLLPIKLPIVVHLTRQRMLDLHVSITE